MRAILTLALSALLLCGCAKEEQPLLPRTYVNFVISINYPDYTILNSPSTAVKVSYYNSLPVGCFGNGVIISNGLEGFNAFDATCTTSDHASINIVDQIFGECPVCKTRYNLLSGYAEGKGNLHLVRYRAAEYNGYINVSN